MQGFSLHERCGCSSWFIMIALLYHLSHDIVTLMWNVTFQPLTSGLHQAMVSTGPESLHVAPWLFVIGAFQSSLSLFTIGGFCSPLF